MARGTWIGLDIGTSSVRAAEVGAGSTAPRLVRFGQVALPAGALRDGEVVDAGAVSEAIRELWHAVRFSHRKVTLGVSNPRVVVRQVEVPYLPLAELRRALPLLVGDQVPIDASQAVVDFAPLEEVQSSDGARSLSGLVVAGVEEMIVRSVDAVLMAGLKVVAVDLSPFAVLRAVGGSPGLGLTSHPEAVIDIGAALTSMIVHENGIPRFVRILLSGGQQVSAGLMEDLGISLADAEGLKRERVPGDDVSSIAEVSMSRALATLVDEIRGSLDYFAATSTSGPVVRVIVCGGGSRLAGLVPSLADALRVPVVPGSVMAGLEVRSTGLTPEQLAFVDPTAAVPVGLAMGAMR